MQLSAKGIDSPFYMTCFHTGYTNWDDCLEVAKNENEDDPVANTIYIVDTTEFDQFTTLYNDRDGREKCLVSCYNLCRLQALKHNKKAGYIEIYIKLVSHYELHNIHTCAINIPHYKCDFGTFLSKKGQLFTNKK